MIYMLREATSNDENFLYALRNDELTRQNSFNSDPINQETHKKWVFDAISSGNIYLFILTDTNLKKDYGQIRLNISSNEAKISFGIVREFRGQSLGKELIKLILEKSHHINNINKLIADVKKENLASCKIFEDFNFTKRDFKTFNRYFYSLRGN